MDRILLEKETKAITGLSKSTRLRLEKEGLFPNRILISKNRVGWKLSEIQHWIKTRPNALALVVS